MIRTAPKPLNKKMGNLNLKNAISEGKTLMMSGPSVKPCPV
jgi:hypothetical protein